MGRKRIAFEELEQLPRSAIAKAAKLKEMIETKLGWIFFNKGSRLVTDIQASENRMIIPTSRDLTERYKKNV